MKDSDFWEMGSKRGKSLTTACSYCLQESVGHAAVAEVGGVCVEVEYREDGAESPERPRKSTYQQTIMNYYCK